MADVTRGRRASTRSRVARAGTALVVTFGVAVATASSAAATPPSAPRLLSVAAGPAVGYMSIHWAPPQSSGTANVTGYEYRVAIDAGVFGPATPFATAGETRAALPCAAPQSAGHGCSFEVRATNGAPGPWSIPLAADWLPPIAAVLGRASAGPAVGQATLTWRPPRKTGGLDVGYSYQVDTGSGWSAPTTIAPGSIVTTGVPPVIIATAVVACPVVSGAGNPCSYMLTAFNNAGAGPPSRVKTSVLAKPGPVAAIQAYTSSVALGTGLASQSITWNPPTNTGGLPVTEEIVWQCATSTGSSCENFAPSWTKVADLFDAPPASSALGECPANGRCVYEVWARNAKGKSYALGTSSPGTPVNLVGTVDAVTPGQVDLQWLNPIDVGSGFGHVVLFECNGNVACNTGSWTNVPADAAPWTQTALGAATSATYACTPSVTCTFRIGYVDAAGNLGGVSNAVTLLPS